MYRVILVDDEQIILQGLTRVFPWAQYDCEVAATASDGLEGLRLIREKQPHILLTDIRMPNMDGLNMIAALKSEMPEMQISVLTAYRDFDYAQRALSLGVCRYLLKPSNMRQLHEAMAVMTDQLKARSRGPIAPQPDADGEAGAFVARAAVRYIEQHYAQRLTLSEVAEQVFVSQWHLSKLINKYIQKSFFDIVNEYRIQKACELLSDPARRIGDVAQTVGYYDVAHFSKTFKKLTGCTPLEYRGKL